MIFLNKLFFLFFGSPLKSWQRRKSASPQIRPLFDQLMSTPFTENIRHGVVSSGPWCLLGVLQGFSGGGGLHQCSQRHLHKMPEERIGSSCWLSQLHKNCVLTEECSPVTRQRRGEPGTEIYSFVQYLLSARCGRGTTLCARNTVESRKTDMPLPLVNCAISSFHSFIGQRNSEVSLPVPSSPNIYNGAPTVFQKLCKGPVYGFYQLASPLQASPSLLLCLIQTPRLRLISEFTTSRRCYLSRLYRGLSQIPMIFPVSPPLTSPHCFI